MRLAPLFLALVAAFVATGNALAGEQTEGKIASSDSLPPSTVISNPNTAQTRRLRTAESPKDEEERGPINVDLAIKDAVHEVRKLTKWKLQFAVWKGLKKPPTKLIQEWKMKYPYSSDPRWAKILAYQEFWGKGPLTYP
ncbi:hypothetical protein P3T76_001555 [Phytophthora citrophthora]|uniref:RxLR effector protein n=1 Tax=Phytophthora citrophthora TaxID=4793 RepID=A0AAD9GYT1_9STRA|nr:hypothetical protein P3T76_001555 [Phytophthora citrophthora]